MRDLTKYPFEIRPLAQDEGGGYLISFPDFTECISDGETSEEAINNGMDALTETIAALEDMELPVPEPGSGGSYSGRFMPTTVKTRIVRIGHSQGIRIPKLIIEQLGLSEETEMEIFPDQLVVRSAHSARQGWEEQFKAMAEAGDDQLLDADALSLTEWDDVKWEW